MAMARRLRWYLDHHEVPYEVIPHPHTASSRQTAEAAHVDEKHLAKCVLLEDERGYLLAVLPASRRIELDELQSRLGRQLELASEAELGDIFEDCEVGAVPPVGAAYGVPTVVDDALLRLSDVYFEAGDHEALMHVSGEVFRLLLSGAAPGYYAEAL